MESKFTSAIAMVLSVIILLCSCGNNEKPMDNETDINNENTLEHEIDVELNEDTAEATDEVYVQTEPNQPKDIINGIPLYIEFAEDFIETDAQKEAVKYYHKSDTEGSEIVVAYGGEFFKIEFYRIQDDWEDDTNRWLWERKFYAYGKYRGDSFVIKYKASSQFSHYNANYALVLTDGDGSEHSYLLRRLVEGGELVAEKTEISKLRRGNQSVIDMNKNAEAINVRFFTYDSEKDPDINNPGNTDYYKYAEESIPTENFVDDFINLMQLHTGIIVDDLWYEGNTICIDLDDYGSNRFDHGSLGSAVSAMQLLMTVSSIQTAEGVEILIDGVRDTYGSHFDFTRIFDTEDFRID